MAINTIKEEWPKIIMCQKPFLVQMATKLLSS